MQEQKTKHRHNFFLDKHVVDDLKNIAARDRRTLSEVVRMALEKYVESARVSAQ